MTPDPQSQAIMDRIRAYQAEGRFHPLTCGQDSSHPVLFPIYDGRKVVLRCEACSYEQAFIPEFLCR